jgi:CDP-diacylglycerol---glycerol-3-phosphate 3-phosphatidyltransferase
MVTNVARQWGARVVEPVARFLSSLGLTPNSVTVLGFLLTALVAFIIARGQLQLAGVLLILTLGMDSIDGTLARMTGSATRFGAFLDSTLDRWAEVLIFVALAWFYLQAGQQTPVLLAVWAMAASLMVSYTRARAEGVGLVCKEGLLTRFERLAILIGGLILQLMVAALWIIAILASITALQRIWVTWRADQATR